MDLDQLRTLLAVVEHGSFTRAATALGLSQSTVSAHIKLLESDVGAQLLDRDRGRVELTSQGAILVGYARQILTLRQQALSHLHAERSGVVGQLAITASTIGAEHLLPPLLAALRHSHRGVAVRLEVGNSRGALASLAQRTCELAVVGRASGDRRFEFRPFGADEIVLVGPLPDRYQLPLDGTANLREVPIVGRGEGSGTRAATEMLLAEHCGLAERPLDIEVGSTESAKRCVLHGLGVTFISRFAVADELLAGRMQVIPLRGTPVARTFHVAWLRGATLSPAAEAFLKLALPSA
ncbi:MAG: LysR family transcriptional regulator [Myxococcales bacterium FL481]|nr:MAG: LysR family transcriptional regulator [Myxococcales bacterium FL481]